MTAADSNIAIIERFQTKTLRLIANAPWSISNKQIYQELQVPSVQEVPFVRFSTSYIHTIKYLARHPYIQQGLSIVFF